MHALEEIEQSILNGKRIQAMEQLIDSEATMNELFEFLISNNLTKEIPVLFKIAQNKNIIKVKGENY